MSGAGDPVWLAFTPAYTAARHAQTTVLGAHAFRAEAPRSLCGYVERGRAGAPAEASARRCVWCARVIAGTTPDRSGAVGAAAEPREVQS